MEHEENELFFKCDICGRRIPEKQRVRCRGIDLCQKHYEQLRKYGKFLDNNPKTIHDLNEYHIMGDVTFIDLYNIKSEVIAQVMIDTEGLDKVKDIKWKLSHGYATNSNLNKYIHQVVLGIEGSHSIVVDHINHNTLNNTKKNLRVATKSQNSMNTNYKGVTETKSFRYYAHIKYNQKMINLGVYDFLDEALYARWYAEQILFKEFRYDKEKPYILQNRINEIEKYVDDKIAKYITT